MSLVQTPLVCCYSLFLRLTDIGLETWATLSIFVLAMVLYPECQLKAQAEIDTVLGCGRLPEFHDRDSLLYLECVVQETLRYAAEPNIFTCHTYIASWVKMASSRPVRLATRGQIPVFLLKNLSTRSASSLGGRRHIQRHVHTQGFSRDRKYAVWT
jgi:hypothetical protein